MRNFLIILMCWLIGVIFAIFLSVEFTKEIEEKESPSDFVGMMCMLSWFSVVLFACKILLHKLVEKIKGK